MRIDDCVSFLFGKAYQQVNAESRRRLAPFGITPMQYSVLHALWERDGRSAAEVGERLVLDSATITGIVDRLERAGLITRQASPSDRRITRLVLTPAGRELRAPVEAEVEAINGEFFARYTPEDAERLRILLRTAAAQPTH